MSEHGSREQLTILDAMFLIAGAAFGLWMFLDEFESTQLFAEPDGEQWLLVVTSVLGGLSMAGAPIILLDRFRGGHRWRSGALQWLAVGLATWSLAPAITLARMQVTGNAGLAGSCFAYSLPLMGLFLFVATLIGGRPIQRWWTCRGWWPEWFGMWVLVGWSLAGLYVLFLVYRDLF
jgi:hypothetical protein